MFKFPKKEKTNRHYLNRYIKLIEYCQITSFEGHLEKHHIVPKSMRGNNKKENLINLPPRIHFVCHKLLHKAFPEHEGCALGFIRMSHKQTVAPIRYYRVSSRDYAYAKSLKSEMMKTNNPMFNLESRMKLCGENNPAKKQSSRDKISKALKGRISPTKGWKYSVQHIKKMSETTKNWWDTHPKEATERRRKLIQRNKEGKK